MSFFDAAARTEIVTAHAVRLFRRALRSLQIRLAAPDEKPQDIVVFLLFQSWKTTRVPYKQKSLISELENHKSAL